MTEQLKEYIEKSNLLMYKTLKELCLIPAPSHFENARAAYCKAWFDTYCGNGAYIDEALNVIFPINCENSDKITVFVAHTDTVFPDREPYPYREENGRIYCPGVADDTASVVTLLLTAKYFVENKIVPPNGVMFVCNSCEEGLGNLKGARQLFKIFENRIETFISFDSHMDSLADRSVGSHRYEVEVKTEGGHSYNKFGSRNAIAELSKIVNEIYKIEAPKKEGTKTTYNVGIIEGGTSVNTIAQSAKMLCEYRSDDKDCLDFMRGEFERIFTAAAKDIDLSVTLVGDRPCGDIKPQKIENLKHKVVPIIEEIIGKQLVLKSSSTDCNIPHSLGVAALCIGVNLHAKVHTREEWLDKESMKTGLMIALTVILNLVR